MFDKIEPIHSDTKLRILEAAGECFAEAGFRHVTVREICARAGVNVAAINYHFQDKKNLYLAALKYWQEAAFEKYPLDRASDPAVPPEERLAVFVRQFLRRVFNEGEASWFGKLIVRELVDPTEGLDMMVQEAARPTFEVLSGIIQDLLGTGATEAEVRLSSASVVGQAIFFFIQRPVIKRLFPGEEWAEGKLDMVAAHVTSFSLNAMKKRRTGARKGEVP